MPRKPTRGKKSKTNRLSAIEANLIGTEPADKIMDKMILALGDTQSETVRAGNYYAFIYYAQKNDLLTDRYPLVAVTGVYDWGFTGINLHLGEQRNYNYVAAGSPFYQVKNTELDTARTLPLMKLVQNVR